MDKSTFQDWKDNLIFWKIDELEQVVTSLERTFGESLSTRKTVQDYDNIQIRAYAHAIIVMKEVLCLIKSGFPDGALALARRLYEQIVMLSFFEKRKDQAGFDDLVHRYYDSHTILAYSNQKLAADFFKNKKQSNYLRNRINKIKKKYANLIPKNTYVPDYWWTGEEKIDSFGAMQKEYDDSFGRILYKRACLSTHVSAMGNYALLGRPELDRWIYTDGTFSGHHVPLILSVYSFGDISSIVFNNLQIQLPDNYEKLMELVHYYFGVWSAELSREANETEEIPDA